MVSHQTMQRLVLKSTKLKVWSDSLLPNAKLFDELATIKQTYKRERQKNNKCTQVAEKNGSGEKKGNKLHSFAKKSRRATMPKNKKNDDGKRAIVGMLHCFNCRVLQCSNIRQFLFIFCVQCFANHRRNIKHQAVCYRRFTHLLKQTSIA